MRNILIVFLIFIGAQVLSAQENNATASDALTPDNMGLLEKLVTADYQKSLTQVTTKRNDASAESTTATAVNSRLQSNPSTGNNNGSNAQIFVINNSKSKVVETKAEPNKAVTKKQHAALEALLGIKKN